RPPEQHLLQNRQVSAQLRHLSVPVRIPLEEPLKPGLPLRIPFSDPRVLRPQPGDLLQRHSQRIPQQSLSTLQDNASRNRHAPQQTRSAAANHPPHTSVSQPTAASAVHSRQRPRHTISEYLQRSRRRFEASPRRAAPKGQQSFISRAAPHSAACYVMQPPVVTNYGVA